jgi:uncharacterized membrane protein YesL
MTPPEPELSRQSYVRSTARSLWDNLPPVVLAGLAFCLAASPAVLLLYTGLPLAAIVVAAVTIAPAWSALLAQEARLLRGTKAGLGTLLRAFPQYWVGSARLALLVAVPLTFLLRVLSLLNRPQLPPGIWLALALNLFGLFLALVLCLHAFPLLVLHDLAAGLAVRNAFVLAVRHVGDTVGLLSMGVLFAFAVVNISPGLLLFLPAVWGLFLVNYCRMAVAEELTGVRE